MFKWFHLLLFILYIYIRLIWYVKHFRCPQWYQISKGWCWSWSRLEWNTRKYVIRINLFVCACEFYFIIFHYLPPFILYYRIIFRFLGIDIEPLLDCLLALMTLLYVRQVRTEVHSCLISCLFKILLARINSSLLFSHLFVFSFSKSVCGNNTVPIAIFALLLI